MILIAMLFHC